MAQRPLIGVTPGFSASDDKLYIANGYMKGINHAGGLAMLLPLVSDEDSIVQAVDMCDGILLAGGPDIDARYFGELNLSCTGAISPLRDSFEILAAKRAFESKKPMLGICRGMQTLNIALGGSIYQDINIQIKGVDLIKHNQEAPGWYPIHDVVLESDSILRQCFGNDIIGVNSFHHQSVKAPGKGLKVTARSADGIVEAIELIGSVFTVGVQWHPELMWEKDPGSLKLFEAFVRSAEKAE